MHMWSRDRLKKTPSPESSVVENIATLLLREEIGVAYEEK